MKQKTKQWTNDLFIIHEFLAKFIPFICIHNGDAVFNWAVGIVWLDAFGFRDDCPIHAIANRFCIDIGCNRPDVVVVPLDIGLVDESDEAPLIPWTRKMNIK